MSSMDLNDSVNARIRRLPDWTQVSGIHVMAAKDISPGATLVSLGRKGASHKGVGQHKSIATLFASAVDQSFLDEICEIEALEYLWLGWPVTAKDLSGLSRLKNLTFLKIDSPRNVTDFSLIARLPRLTHLFLENAKHMADLGWLLPLKDQLVSLGIEGSMWTDQKVLSLAPLSGFGFEALCMTSARLVDKDLTPLAGCPNLRHLKTARFAPKEQFDRLEVMRPDIQCSWFDRYDI